MVADNTYQAFLSYSHADDEYLDGAITWLRQELVKASKAVTGHHFTIFQDQDGIAFGEHWQSRLDSALESATVLLPILTPSFFVSEACCAEVMKFLEYEESIRRNDLILPIYMIDANIFDEPTQSIDGQIARVLSKRQHRDWRRIALDLRGSKDIKLRVANLAREIAEAISTRKASSTVQKIERRHSASNNSEKDREIIEKQLKKKKQQPIGTDNAIQAALDSDAIITLSRNKTVLGPNPSVTMRNFVLFMNYFFNAHENDIENDRIFIWVLDLGNRIFQQEFTKEDLSDFMQFHNAGTLALYLKAFQSFDLEENSPKIRGGIARKLTIPDPTYRATRWNWLKDRSVVYVRNLRLDEMREIYGDEEKMLSTVQLKDIGITIDHLLPKDRPPESWRAELKRIYGNNAQAAGATITGYFREVPWTSDETAQNVRYFVHREESRRDGKDGPKSLINRMRLQVNSAELPSPSLHHDESLRLLYWGARYRLGQISDTEIEAGIHSLAYLKNMGFRALHLNHFMNIFSHN